MPALAKYLIVILFITLSHALKADTINPQRIVSLNVCTDQWLLLLADPEQIASITHLSHEEGASYLLAKALKYPTNKGRAEDILPFKPDLVISSAYTSPNTLNLLRQLQIRVETLPIADDWESTLKGIQQMAQLVGHPERGQAVIDEMQQRLKQLPAISDDKPIIASYEPNGYTVGNQSLLGQAIQQAGWQNAAELAGIRQYGQLDLETMIRLHPAAIIESPYRRNTWSRAEALPQHPALRKAGINPQVIQLPSAMTICAGPWSVTVAERLAQARLELSTKAAH
ncbi:ABC transporter substrate-binding protein [Thiofilum flexile]|uniref:ABC transporter substrate-binding protein n=1 Tax=Thiofilum flexile TaxID=125627 RepID=UPI000363A1A0|nr:ABC transporter substrate-binding protein [Thiofilum flexile]